MASRSPWRTSSVCIGCAGWSIARRHAALFGDGDSMLARYATAFPVVEVNSSFYRHHQRRTWERWAREVPDHFRFSAKMPREISHERGLRGAGPVLDRFLDETEGLDGKLGGLLLQLPPSLEMDLRVATIFFRMLRARTDAPVACEPRHPSWDAPKADALFARFGVSRVGADPAPSGMATGPRRTGPWRYWRWHGAPRIYYSDYSESALRRLAADVHGSGSPRQPAWVIFDNTAHGFATTNAVRLQQILTERDGATHA